MPPGLVSVYFVMASPSMDSKLILPLIAGFRGWSSFTGSSVSFELLSLLHAEIHEESNQRIELLNLFFHITMLCLHLYWP